MVTNLGLAPLPRTHTHTCTHRRRTSKDDVLTRISTRREGFRTHNRTPPPFRIFHVRLQHASKSRTLPSAPFVGFGAQTSSIAGHLRGDGQSRQYMFSFNPKDIAPGPGTYSTNAQNRTQGWGKTHATSAHSCVPEKLATKLARMRGSIEEGARPGSAVAGSISALTPDGADVRPSGCSEVPMTIGVTPRGIALDEDWAHRNGAPRRVRRRHSRASWAAWMAKASAGVVDSVVRLGGGTSLLHPTHSRLPD